jgi:hypothetical protein
MNRGIIQDNYLAVDFHGIGQQHRILIDSEQSTDDTGFAVAGGSVQKNGFLRGKSRS